LITAFSGPGHAEITSKTYVTNAIVNALENKIDKKVPAQHGNIATLKADGSLDDSGTLLSNLATVSVVSEKVSKTGTESIAGVKTFSDIPIVPTAPLPALQ
jgi:glycerol kinase